MEQQYHFAFAWQSTYGHMVRLVRRLNLRPGVIVDLGCGHAAIAEPLREMGFEYVGVDLEPESVAEVAGRGFEAHQVDLRSFLDLADSVKRLVDGRPVTAVVMLDVLEHVPDTRGFLAAIRELVEALGRPVLGLSLPNVAHFDLGAKLAFGRWDVTKTGLLDETHVSLFDHRRMKGELAANGFFEIERNDFEMVQSDQAFPADHAALNRLTPLSGLLRALRSLTDDFSLVNQFVRFFALGDTAAESTLETGPGPTLSVIVRTQGQRNEMLLEALVCLGAQTHSDFEVLVMVHTTSTDLLRSVHSLVASFDQSFVGRIRVIQVVGGGRARPLNVAIDEASGRYLAFLDDDDHVTARWVEHFIEGVRAAPGVVIRSRAGERDVQRVSERKRLADYESVSRVRFPFAPTFDLIGHLRQNQSPICSVAMPMAVIQGFGQRFDEDLDVIEDWDLIVRLAELVGVHDTNVVTSIYRRWVDGESSLHTIDSRVWEGTRQRVLQKLSTRPFLLPTGAARRLSNLVDVEADQGRLLGTIAERDREIQVLRSEMMRAYGLVHEIQSSEWWRITAPMRRVGGKFRSLFRPLRSRLSQPDPQA